MKWQVPPVADFGESVTLEAWQFFTQTGWAPPWLSARAPAWR